MNVVWFNFKNVGEPLWTSTEKPYETWYKEFGHPVMPMLDRGDICDALDNMVTLQGVVKDGKSKTVEEHMSAVNCLTKWRDTFREDFLKCVHEQRKGLNMSGTNGDYGSVIQCAEAFMEYFANMEVFGGSRKYELCDGGCGSIDEVGVGGWGDGG